MGRTPADVPGRQGRDVVPTKTEHMDLERKAKLHREVEEAHPHERHVPWWRRLIGRDTAS